MSLIAAWNFNEASGNALDIAGGGHTANATGTTRVAGQSGYGNAVSMNGSSSDYFNIPSGGTPQIGSLAGPMTISAWILCDDFSANTRTIFSTSESPSTDVGAAFSLTFNGVLEFVAKGVLAYTSVTATITTGIWTHVAAVFDSAFDVTFFVNGVQKDTIAGAAAILTHTDNTFIGGAASGVDLPNINFWDGLLDDIRIYDHAQTGAEINTDMNTPLGGGAATFSVLSTGRRRRYWVSDVVPR